MLLLADAAHGGPAAGATHSHARPAPSLRSDDRHGTLTLRLSSPAPARALTVRVEPADAGAFFGPFDVELAPVRGPVDPAGTASRFVGTHADLVGLLRFRASLREPGATSTTTFDVDARAAAEAFVCPMHCEGARTYAAAGGCPVCRMALRSVREAHADHSPKHGGTLFMASDGWHHLEGALPSMSEFRLYVYNDFTQPISAAPLARRSWLRVVTPGGESVRLALSDAGQGRYLRVALPAGLSFPLDLELALQFEGREQPERFDFRFEGPSD